MDVESAFEAIPSKFTPAATAARIVVVLALPRKVNNGYPIPLAKPAVNPAAHRAELKLAHVFTVELDEGGDDQVKVVRVPHLHLGDAPIPNEPFKCSCSDHSSSSANFLLDGTE